MDRTTDGRTNRLVELLRAAKNKFLLRHEDRTDERQTTMPLDKGQLTILITTKASSASLALLGRLVAPQELEETVPVRSIPRNKSFSNFHRIYFKM